MYLCYLDESGSTARNSGTPCFVLLGLAIHAKSWRQKDAEVGVLLDRHNLYGEVHTAWMARKYPEQERIRGFAGLSPEARREAVLKERRADLAKASMKGKTAVSTLARNYRKTEAYIHLTHAERTAALLDLAGTIGGWGDCVLFADIQDKSTIRPEQQEEIVLDFAFEQVVTRFHHFLARISADLGIIVQDRNETAANRLTALARRYHEKGTAYSQIDRVVETPLFVDSHLTSMVQMADLCAYAVRRRIENGETALFDRVYPRFDRLSSRVVGIRHYTGPKACGCQICKDHGR